LLRGEASLELAKPRIRAKASKKTPRSAVSLDANDLPLFNRLRELRKDIATQQGVPPYVIFGDVSLVEMSQRRPRNEHEFLEITGVGQVKLERHGATFLEAIADQ
jgi:ATP-dependent DNA helicase RecQ